MNRFDTEKAVTLTIHHPAEGAETFSAILERDPHFLNWNRISLIGSKNDQNRFLRFRGEGQFQWELYDNLNWPGLRDQSWIALQTCGTGIITRLGMAQGVSIARESIQKFADIQILSYVETTLWDEAPLAATYCFLQRPSVWYPHRKSVDRSDRLSRRGDWYAVPGTELKFRHIYTGYRRDDRRVSHEVEVLDVPGIEVAPTVEMAPEVFVAEAEQLWFSFRILIAFRFRLHVRPLSETISQPGLETRTWHTVEIQPRDESDNDADLSFHVITEELFAKAAGALLRCRGQRELLHAATWGYADSFNSSVLESQLTNRVEAVERLVCVYEDTNSLTREVVDREEWKPIRKALKKTVDGLELPKEVAARVKQSQSRPTTLTLLERIERMASRYQGKWTSEDRELLSGLGLMINARNDIVHGRCSETELWSAGGWSFPAFFTVTGWLRHRDFVMRSGRCIRSPSEAEPH
ncbi:MAG: hypothetical protein RIB97_20425, partial [Nitratireductor sp.]